MIRKLAINQDSRFRWSPPRDEGLATNATLTVYFKNSGTVYNLAGRGADTVTAISPDRKRITVEWGTSGAPFGLLFGNPAPCWLQYGGFNQAPCRVIRVVSVDPGPPAGGVLELSEQLPVGATPGGQLEWLSLSADIPSIDLPVAPKRAIKWVVNYTATEWGQAGPTQSTDRGTVAAVWVPFATGLTDATLAKIAPWTTTARPAGQSSWSDQLEAGLDYLVSVILPNLPEGVWEDDLVGEPWQRAHALATQIIIIQDLLAKGVDRAQALEALIKEFESEVKNRLARPEWIDVNHDNLVDSGETIPPNVQPILSHVTDPSIFDARWSDSRLPQRFVRTRIGDPM